MEVVKFTNDPYRSLSDDTIITSSSHNKEMVCIQRNRSTRKAFLEKVVNKFDEKSYCECLKR